MQYVLRFTDNAGVPLADATQANIFELFSGLYVGTTPVDGRGFTQAYSLLQGLLYQVTTTSASLPSAAVQPSTSEIITVSPASAARAAAIIGSGVGAPVGVPPASTEVTFAQTTPASVWTIAHDLGYPPAVTVVDSSGETVIGDIAYPNASSVIITFSQPIAGTAYLV